MHAPLVSSLPHHSGFPAAFSAFISLLCSRPPGFASVPMTRFWELFCGLSSVSGHRHTPRFSDGPCRGAVRGAQHREICGRRGDSRAEDWQQTGLRAL